MHFRYGLLSAAFVTTFTITLLAVPGQSADIAHCPSPPITTVAPEVADTAPKGTADLPAEIDAVVAALHCYQDHRGAGPDALPDLQQAQFDFQTVTSKTGGFTVSFFVFKLGASVEKDHTNQIGFTYALPKKKTATGQALKKAKPPQQLSDELVAYMQSAAAVVKDRAKLEKLDFNKLSIKVEYAVKFDGNIGVNIPIQLVTIGPNFDAKKSEVQTVTLTFAPPE